MHDQFVIRCWTLPSCSYVFASRLHLLQHCEPRKKTIGCARKKVAPIKRFGICSLQFFCVKFCKFVGNSCPHISTTFCRFITIFECLIQKYRFSISIVLLHLPPSPNLFLFFLMNLIHSFLLPLPHLMNSSSPATLTSTLIIIQITLPLSFSLFCHRLT